MCRWRGNVPAETVAPLTRIATRRGGGHAPALGINVLPQHPLSALAIAQVEWGPFLRVNVVSGAWRDRPGRIRGQPPKTVRRSA